MNEPENPRHRDREADPKAPRAGASWGGSVASAGPAPGVAGDGPRPRASDRKAAAGGGPQPGTSEPVRAESSRARQRPRQPRARKRLHQPNTRFNDAEYELVVSAAARCELSVAGFLARAALAAARDLERTAADIAGEREVIQELFAARRRLGWAGSNLNQAVKALHSGAEVARLPAAIAAVTRAAGRVDRAVTALLDTRRPPA